jgi:hypothetical protein
VAAGARTRLQFARLGDPHRRNRRGSSSSPRTVKSSRRPGVERSLLDLSDDDLNAGRLPSAVHAVARRAPRTARSSENPGGRARPARALAVRDLDRASRHVARRPGLAAIGGARRAGAAGGDHAASELPLERKSALAPSAIRASCVSAFIGLVAASPSTTIRSGSAASTSRSTASSAGRLAWMSDCAATRTLRRRIPKGWWATSRRPPPPCAAAAAGDGRYKGFDR